MYYAFQLSMYSAPLKLSRLILSKNYTHELILTARHLMQRNTDAAGNYVANVSAEVYMKTGVSHGSSSRK